MRVTVSSKSWKGWYLPMAPEKKTCVICGQTKAFAYVVVNGAIVCTEDLMTAVQMADNLGLIDMKQRLAQHHTVAIVSNNTGS